MNFDFNAFPAAQAHMFGGDGSTWHHMSYGAFGGWMHPFGGMFMLLFIFLVGYALFAVLRRGAGERSHAAVEILKTRFAKGEISREEYEDTLKSIR